MIKKEVFTSREEWLSRREKLARIGGSDAGSIIGVNPYRSAVDVWESKKNGTGGEISNDAVKYGIEAEDVLRQLFILDYPDLKVEYEPFNYYINDRYEFAAASLDGWLTDEKGRSGILEIKTTTIMNSSQTVQWQGRIPDTYFAQLLHYFAVTDAEFAKLTAKLTWKAPNREVFSTIKNYHIERFEVEEDIEYLMREEAEFWKSLKENRRPFVKLNI